MIHALKTEPTKKSANIFATLFIVFFLSGIVLLALQSTNLRTGIKGVQSQIPMIGAAFFRQYAMISATTQVIDLRGVIEGRAALYDWQTDTSTFLTYLQEYIDDELYYGEQFYQGLSKLPVEMQNKFAKKNVGFYDYDEDRKKTLSSMVSVTEGYQMMLERHIRLEKMALPQEFEPGIDTSNPKFAADNSLNDLLVQSQDQIDQLTDYFDDSTNSTTLKTAMIMAGVIFSCLIFTIISIRFSYLIASETKIFMTMIFRMNPRDCEAIKLTLQNFLSWLNTDQESPIMKKFKRQTDRNNNPSSTKFRRAFMRSFNQYQRSILLKLLPLSALFICWSIIYFFMTSNFIRDIQDSKKRMEAALQALNNQTLFVNQMISIPLSNFTATQKNEPLLDNINEALEYLKNIEAFVDKFRDRKRRLTPLQQKVLFNFRCEDLASYVQENYIDYIYAYSSCFVIAKGKDSVGLVDINTEFYNIGLYVLGQYPAFSQSEEGLAGLFLIGVTMGNDYVNSAEGFLKMLYRATYKSFEDEVHSLKRSSLSLTVSINIVVIIAVVISWHVALIKVFKTYKVDWYILQVIPIPVMRNNKHLQQYLLNRSDQIFQRFTSFS